MGLDKLRKKPHQLVSKRKDGKRPGYYGPDEGHYDDPGHGSNSSSSSGNGGGNGGGDNRENYITQQYTAPKTEPEPEYTVQDDLTDFATNVMKEASPLGGFEDDDEGETLYITKKPTVPYVSPTRTMKEQAPYLNYKPGPNYVTAEELSNLNRGTGDVDQLSSTLSKIQAVNPIEKQGFFDSVICKV